MDGPLENVDEFRVRPINAVSGLVADKAAADRVVQSLVDEGADVSAVGLLFGESGRHILDHSGKEHGIRSHFVRFFQKMGYDDTILGLYDEGLRQGEAVIVVPCSFDERIGINRLLGENGGHAVYYYTSSSAESLTGP